MSLRQRLRAIYDSSVGRYFAVVVFGLAGPAFVSLGLAEIFPHAGFRMIFPIVLILTNALLYLAVRPTEHRTERSHLFFVILGCLRLFALQMQ